MEYVTLNNGVKMPLLGYGVYQTPPEETERCVLEALETGYRSIDTAQAYYKGRRGKCPGKMRDTKGRDFCHDESLDCKCRI